MTLEELKKFLKETYKDKGLSDKILEVYAKKILREHGEDDEEKIKEAVEDLEGELTIHQSMMDQVRALKTENEKLQKLIKEGAKPEEKGVETEESQEEDKKDNKADEPPAWAKALMEDIKGLKSEKVQETTRKTLSERLDEMKISKAYYEPFIQGKTFESDEEMNEFVEGIKENHDTFIAELGGEKMGGGANPDFSKDKKIGAGEQSSMMKNYLKDKNQKDEKN